MIFENRHGWDFNTAFSGKETTFAVIRDALYSCVYSPNVLNRPCPQEQSQAAFGILVYTEPGDELPDV